jgi:hypothetical protein
VVKVKAAVEPEQTGEAAVAQVAAAAPARFIPPPEPEKPTGNPVSRFIGSFSFMEKFLVLVGLGGLALLFTYIAS